MTTITKAPLKKSVRFSTDAARWRAVLDKDDRGDGQFWYAVNTTRVYCRPSCPSRLPKRENVLFFANPLDAESSGFRACQRCDPKGAGVAKHQAGAIAAACRLMETSDRQPTLSQMAAAAKMSPAHFHRLFRASTGVTPKQYADNRRAGRVKNALARRSTVTEAIYEAGFNSNGRFYAGSKKMLGMNPKEYRAGGRGNTIRFAIGKCSLGSILVACSEKGVCAISLGDDPALLARNLQDQFPQANIVGDDTAFEKLVAAVVGFVESPHTGLNLPLDIRGTSFQQRVWKELQKIPAGRTVSYAQLAKRLGIPRSFRAVAGACGANKIAVAIPCHRVVRTNGELSGYRWGVARKRTLLAREKRT